MTEQEAIEDIKRQLWEINSEEADITLSTESLKMAIKALEKQIAMKPILNKVYICPTCKSEMYCEPGYMQLHFNYCTECGQKLDWE